MAANLGRTSTADEVLEGIDLQGKRALVTGVTAGIGGETARVLVAHGADVVGTARDLGKAERKLGPVREAAARRGSFELAELDLASLASVRACADRLTADGRPFDLVIANAGVMAIPFGLTEDGFEIQFGTNHLGHFLLVNRIAPLMRPGARLVMLSSSGHRGGDVDLDDPNFERTPYNQWLAYARSKTANMLFAVEFDRRHAPRGIRASGVHPGRVDTELFRHLGEGGLDGLVATIDKGLVERGLPPSITKTPAQGAATSVWAGVAAPADLVGGRFCEDCGVSPVNDSTERLPDMAGVRSYAIDPANARALWAKSEEWVGESFAT
ncbi:NAD(P)-dependent dehydrogenase, short-chain alcohol dehydrogenase family [Novosphingobium sp. CF614]|uniref:SDR family NAD(P)-dependent oxidoreductase n=1 Tax=Novosphingobium sp. CF614 TaxID=1884364 RepID=UPI0008EA56B7|nr:SDR family NAD(P)-dependent oxidoreductase [Novosphingobium sp. CF614]SFF96453.1 NAD(P)-dependent dehydrogenase, short-chain alcohol dehydrogenase family [Novosphingobium sp. CF614]